MADFLVKILMECGQNVPDFLEHLKPADEKIDFDDDSGDEEEEEAGAGGDAGDSWGAGGGGAAPAPAQDAWVTNDGAAGGDGW